MKNKNILLRAEVAEKSEGIEPLTQAHQLTLWDNLLYQTVTEKSSAIRDAILQMLVADNFLRKNDIESSGELIKNDKDLRRLAKAYVVIPKNVPNNAPTLTAISQKPREKDFTRLKKQLDVFEAKIELEDYTNGLKEVDEAVKNLENENREDFNTVYEEYLEAVQAAYEKATEIIDPETGDVTYEGLELPEFSFTPKNIFDEGYLEERLSPKSLNIVQKAKDEGADNENSLKGYLEKRQSKDNRVIIENKKKQTKTVFYKRNIIQVEEPVAPLTSFIADAQYSHSDASKFYLNLLISYPDTEVDVENNDLTVRFDDEGTAEGFELKVVERTDNSILLSSYPEELNPQDAGKNLQISGSITLDNEDILTIDTKQMEIGGKRAIGRLQSSKLAAQLLPKLEHYGINKVGVVDFRKVEQEVCCYVPGEVSRIENILAKEYRERSTRQLLSTETTTENTTETEIEKLSDTTTAERNELSTEISSIINQDKHKDYGASAGVEGSLGGVSFYANGYMNGSSSTSTSNSNSTSETYAQEVTTRALERVVQKVSERRTSRILREFEENNKHGFDNRAGETHVTGIYRWVDKIYTNRLINYGKRLVYEFSIPEPSRFFKSAIVQILESGQQQAGNPEGLIFPEEPIPPQEFGITSAEEINAGNYQEYAALYGAQVNAPLPEYEYVGTTFTKSEAQGDGSAGNGWKTNKAIEKEIQIPEGYKSLNARASVQSQAKTDKSHFVAVTAGSTSFRLSGTQSSFNLNGPNNYKDKVPVSVSIANNWVANVNVVVYCERTEEAYQQWQNETFDAIWEAYRNRVLEYEAKVREFNDFLYSTYTPPTPDDEETTMEFNPLLNRALEKRELKRLAIDMMARPLNILTARNNYAGNSETVLNLNSHFEKHASYVKFFEQVFDWEVMAYTFYPYYYAAKTQWKDLFQQSNGTDDVFQAFLQSGMARMEVPVRPGFEDLVNYFMETGSIWMGNQLAVDMDDDFYLSVAEELQQPAEGVVENEWETRVPTELTILQANAAPLDETGLPCCHNENEEDNLAYGSSVMHGKDDEVEP
ncbi:MAG TPA: hypothetical protein VKX34_00295 [Aequorivita sp.]|nr:hypothetical protein [Aequorivita sp.]